MRVWDLATGHPVGAPLTGHTKRVDAVATAQLRGRPVVVTGGRDDRCGCGTWPPAPPGRRSPATPTRGAVATAQSDERTVVISGGRDKTVRVWDLDARTRQ